MIHHDTGFTPDPENALDVLAFVLCPAEAFAPGGQKDELAAVRELMLPMKAEAARRCLRASALRRRQ
jgi:hypothetical protein